jgi:hypothetical protein
MADDIIVNPRAININITFADARASIHAEGIAYNPDIVDDLCNRLSRLFATTLETAIRGGYSFDFPLDDDDDDDDDATT